MNRNSGLNTVLTGRMMIRLAAAFALSAGIILVTGTPCAEAAGLLIADGGFGGVLEIESHSVTVTINNGIAVTEVTQVFRNTENRQVEALYTFPVPKGASVANFSMWINGNEMIGEVLEKERARKIYESYKQVRRDPGLLEQTDYKTFQMRIFPIGPRAEQKVKIRYYQEMDYDNDWITYVYPLSTVAHHGGGSKTTGGFSLTLHAKSQIPIVAMESPSHKEDFVIAMHGDLYRQASLETTGGNLNRDVVLTYRLSRAKTGLDIICSKTDGEDGYFCLTLTAGDELADKAEPMDYVFILDISGSMADESKLKISRDCIGAFIEKLGEKDRFEIITFNVAPATLFDELKPADQQAKTKAAMFLTSQKAGGGTVLRPALTAAYKYCDPDRPLNTVIFSDGMTEQGERSELLEAVRRKPPNGRVFCVGVGNEVNRPLLKQLAEDAGGLAAFLSRGDNFDQQAKAFRRKLTKPAMTNVKIAFDGNEAYDVEPRKLPNLYHGTPLRLYGRYSKVGPAKIAVRAEINGQEFRRDLTATFPVKDKSNPEIERMWAWQKIQRLMSESRRPEAVDEVIRLGEAYSIATEYTSFIVLENDAEYKRWKIERKNALRIKRDLNAHKQLLERLETMRTESLAGLGPQAVSNRAATPPAGPALANPRPSPNPPRLFPRSGGGGGPVGLITLMVIGVLAAMAVLHRRKAKTCVRKPPTS